MYHRGGRLCTVCWLAGEELLSDSADPGHIDSAAGQQIPLPESSVPVTVFFRRQFFDIGESGGGEPVSEFLNGVMMLVLGCPPVPRIADAILVAGVGTEADDLIECAIDDGDSAEECAEVAEWQEDSGGQSGGAGSEC